MLKKGKRPDWEYMMYETKQFPVGEDYFVYVFEQLYSGQIKTAEVHWFQETSVGIVNAKVKKWR
jgi:hypothetical protein